MIIPSDPDYQETKLIMLGQVDIKPEFLPLISWIESKYKVKPLNIYYDVIGRERRPRIQVIFEKREDELLFRDRTGFGFDSRKQKIIAEKFSEIVTSLGLSKKTGFFNSILNLVTKRKFDTRNILVVFTSFRPVAMEDSNNSIPNHEIEQLKNSLRNSALWMVSRFSSTTTFFLYTDTHVENIRNTKEHQKWSEQYFDLLSPRDRFKYFDRDSFIVQLDSKENLDKNYQGNLFYYYK